MAERLPRHVCSLDDRVWDDVASPDLDGRALQLTFAFRDGVHAGDPRPAALDYLRADVVRRRLGLLHQPRLLEDDGRPAGHHPHVHRHGPRRPRDCPLDTRDPALGPPLPPRRRAAIHVTPVRRTARRDRRRPLHRVPRRRLRWRASGDRQRLLHGRVDPHPAPPRTLEYHRRPRDRHPRLGQLAQHDPTPRQPRRPIPCVVRLSLSDLRCPTIDPLQLPDLLLQLLDASRFRRAHPRRAALIDVGLVDPRSNRLDP